MKNGKHLVMVTIIMLSCLLMFTFADDAAKAVQAIESNVRIIYNGKEAALGIKPFSIGGYNYLSIRSLADLFGKNIDWNQTERKVLISDRPDPALENLKAEVAAKDKGMAELEEKLNILKKEAAMNKNKGIRELQDEINYALGEYEDVLYKTILSGNEDEVRVRIEVDLSRGKSAWNHLTNGDREELIEEVYGWISAEYETAKIKGCIIDIAESKELLTFHYDWQGKLAYNYSKNYSTISSLEDRLNNDYSGYFGDIHFSIALMGNDNSVEYYLNVQEDRFDDEWEDISDNSLNKFMKELSNEIQDEFEECHVFGYVYDTDSESILAECEKQPDDTFFFKREL